MLKTYLECPVLRQLFKHVDDNSKVQITAVDQEEGWQTAKIEQFDDLGPCSEFIRKYMNSRHIYVNVNLMEPNCNSGGKRGASASVTKMVAIGLDIDTSGGKHSGKRISKEDALSILEDDDVFGMPSIINSTGGGLHAFYFLEEPLNLNNLVERTKAKRLLEGINERFREEILQFDEDFKYERLTDFPRVLRVTGTWNYKYEDRRIVYSLHKDEEATFSYDELFYEVPGGNTFELSDEDLATVKDNQDDIRDLTVRACLKVDRSWGDNGSSFIMKLANRCVRYGCTSETAVSVMEEIIQKVGCHPDLWSSDALEAKYEQSYARFADKFGECFVRIRMPESDLEFARLFKSRVDTDGRAVFVRDWNKWYIWNGCKFSDNNSMAILADIQNELVEDVIRAFSPTEVDAQKIDKERAAFKARAKKWLSVKHLDAMPKIIAKWSDDTSDSFDTKANILTTPETVIEFQSDGSVSLRSPVIEDRNTRYTKTKLTIIRTHDECPRWLQFIKEICVDPEGNPSKELAEYLQKIAGWALTGFMSDQAIYILYGSGHNGKSVFVDTLMEMLGEYAAAASRDLLTGSKNSHETSIASMFNRRLVTTDEIDQGVWLKESQVKALTSGGSIRCRRLYENEWEFKPTHTLMISTNHLPQIKGTDQGIWRRLRIIPFLANFKGRVEEGLEDKLKAELPGILHWAIEGYRMAVTEKMDPPQMVKDMCEEHREEMDYVANFVSDECELGQDYTADNTELLASFKLYLDQQGERSDYWNMKRLTMELKRFGVGSSRTKKGRFKTGLRLKPPFPDDN